MLLSCEEHANDMDLLPNQRMNSLKKCVRQAIVSIPGFSKKFLDSGSKRTTKSISKKAKIEQFD